MDKEMDNLQARRIKIVNEMGKITSMRKGTLNAVYQNVPHKNGEVVKKGPYYILSWKGPGGKTASESIPVSKAPRIQREVDNHRKFRQLSDEYVEVCERLSASAAEDGAADSEQGKKNGKSG
jgi:hypothetical protein